MSEPIFEAEQTESPPLVVDSMVGVRSGSPSVKLIWGDRTLHFHPRAAQKLADEILKESAFNEIDACLFNWSRQKLKQPPEASAQLVQLFRAKRRGEMPSCTLNLQGRSIRPETARRLGRFLIEAAAMTEAEAFLGSLLLEELEQPPHVVNAFVQELRDMRGAETLSDTPLPTTERLARAMEAANCPAPMIERARAGYYDDFKSDLATPLIQLAIDLRQIGQAELVDRVMDGEFDGTPEESAAWFEAEGKNLLPPQMWEMFGYSEPQGKRPKPKGFGR